jgi:hypothetical protein
MIIPVISSVTGGTQLSASDTIAMRFSYSPEGNGYSGDGADFYKHFQKYYSQTQGNRYNGDLAFVTVTRHRSISAILREETLGQINEFLQLEDGWDGYDGYSPSASVCEYAREVILRLASEFPELPSPEISPTSNGTLTLSWRAPLGHACIEIGDENFSAYVRYQDNFIPMKGVCSKLGADELQLISACLFQ